MSEVQRIAKPDMRGMLMKHVKKHLVIMVGVSLLSGVLYKYGITEPKRRQYDTFFRNYDDEKALKVMNEAGYMQSYRGYKA